MKSVIRQCNRHHLWGPRAASSMTRTHRSGALFVHAVLILLVLGHTEATLESDRWWSSPSIVSALGVTPQQLATIERMYEDSLTVTRYASEEATQLTEQITELIVSRVYDERLLHLTEKLEDVRRDQCELRRRMFDSVAQALTPEQREMMAALNLAKVME
jgi:Spy/CpxP family protein refolding chaperone